MPPGHRRYVEAVVTTVQMVLLLRTIRMGNHHIETATQRNDYFLLLAISMAASGLTTRHIVRPEYPLNLERKMVQVLEKGKVAAIVDNFG